MRRGFADPQSEGAPKDWKDKKHHKDHDWDDHWDDYWDDWDDHLAHGLVHGLFYPFLGFPYYWHHFHFHHHPFFHDHYWYHFWFGYYPVYHAYAYPTYVEYVPYAYPSTQYVVYRPVYIEPDVAPLPPDAEPSIPPELANQLHELQGNGDAVTWLERGGRSFKAGDYAGAADAFRRTMMLEPNNAVPKFALAHALLALGQYRDASFMIRRGLQILPQWPTVGTALHELYGHPDELAEHTIALRAYLEAHPTDGDARFLLGYVSFFSGDLDGAEEAFVNVQANNPEDDASRLFTIRIAEVRAELENSTSDEK